MTQPGMDRLQAAYDELVRLHGWESFRTPRNMALALVGSVGTVASALQFAPENGPTPDQVSPQLQGDLADCLVYLLGLSGALGVDLLEEATTRIDAAVDQARHQQPTGQ